MRTSSTGHCDTIDLSPSPWPTRGQTPTAPSFSSPPCPRRGSTTSTLSLAGPALSSCLPSPTLSPTDPVPRGLLTLCPGASSGPLCQCMYVCIFNIYMYIYVYICIYAYIYTYIYMCVCVCVYIYIYMCVYICVYIYTYMCIHMCIRARSLYVFCVYIYLASPSLPKGLTL